MRSRDSASGREPTVPDPYPMYAWLLEHAPVSQVHNPGAETGATWLVTSFSLGDECLRDRRLSNDACNTTGRFRDEDARIASGLLSVDGAAHKRLRGLVSEHFTRKGVSAWEPMIRRVCADVIDDFADADSIELVEQFALPVPVNIIHEVLGVPPEARCGARRCFDLFYDAGLAQPPDQDAYEELLAYIDHLIAYKTAHRGDDLGTLLVEQVERGELHGQEELRSMLLGILGAGHVTTVQFFACAVLRLLEHPTVRQEVLDGSLDWGSCINELLRFDSPIQASQYRFATEDMQIGDTSVRRGDAVLISVAGANRDPARFAHPNVFDAHRNEAANLAFGRGVHLCLGVHLARLEGEVGLRALFDAYPQLSLGVGSEDIAWGYGPMLRGPKELPVQLGPQAQTQGRP
jgi:cytochrome P450